MKNKFGLLAADIDAIISVLSKYPKVENAYLFGSRAKGNFKNGSDIDLALKGAAINFDTISQISYQLNEESAMPYKFDVLNYHTIKEPALKEHIDRVGIELYCRWNETKLGDVLEIKYGKDHKELSDGNIPIYGSGGIMRYGNKALYDKKSILIPRKGTLNNLFYKDEPFWTVDTMFWTKINEEKVYPKFLFYQLTTIDYTNLNVGSAVPSLTIPVIEEIDIFLPPIQEQIAIASILTSIDDKIDLLNRQNKTLEELAETLFRSYFLMTNEENNYVELGNYVECINGVSYKSSELNPSKVGMVSLKSFDRNGGFSIDGFKEFTGKYKEKQVVLEGDLIVAHTDITQDAEVIGNPALVISNPNFNTMIISMDIVKVISKVDWVSIEFLYFLMKTREFKSHCEGCANGSTVLHLNKQAIPTFEFPEPDKTKISDFTKQAKDIVSKIFLNHKQLKNLVKTRDTLLPKLMSGEVRVKI